MTAFRSAASGQLKPFDAASAPSADLHRALIDEGPVVAVEGPLGETAYVVTDPAAARALLTDPRFVKNPGFAPRSWLGEEISLEPAYEEQRSITTADGPEHMLLRRMQARLLSPAVVRDQKPRIEGIARTLLAEIDARCRRENRPADLMREFCYRFPLTVIGGLLGVRDSDLGDLMAVSTQSAHASAEDRVAELTAIQAIIELALAARTSGSVAAGLRDSPEFAELGLSEAELSYVVTGLVFAGQETTGAFLGSLLHAYLAHPGRATLDGAGRVALVEESLRLYPASTFTLWRFASADAELCGRPIPARSPVVADIEACNLHPDTAGEDGARFDPGRGTTRHLAFGHGPHACLGARLAEVEAAVTLDVLASRHPNARPAEEQRPPWVRDAVVRRLSRLPVWLS